MANIEKADVFFVVADPNQLLKIIGDGLKIPLE